MERISSLMVSGDNLQESVTDNETRIHPWQDFVPVCHVYTCRCSSMPTGESSPVSPSHIIAPIMGCSWLQYMK